MAWEGGYGAPRAGRVRSGPAAASSIQILCIPFVRPRDTLRGGFNLTLMSFNHICEQRIRLHRMCTAPPMSKCMRRARGWVPPPRLLLRAISFRSSCAFVLRAAEGERGMCVAQARICGSCEENKYGRETTGKEFGARSVGARGGWLGGGRAARPPPCKRPRGPPGQASAGGGSVHPRLARVLHPWACAACAAPLATATVRTRVSPT